MNFFYTDGYEEYAKFPMHYLNVTQNYNEGNHLAHWKDANYIDYPIDLGGMDGGRDYLFAPVNMMVIKINGIGNSNVSNKIFLESINPVYTPKYGKKKIFMTAVHFEDSDIKNFNLYEGKIIKAGEAICFEGKETAIANHLHITCGLGIANKSVQNNNGKWVTFGDCKRPEEIFYIDSNFTIIRNLRGINFQLLPKIELTKYIGTPVVRDNSVNQIEVLVDNLNVRADSSINSSILGYIKKGIYNYSDIIINDYHWYKIDAGWIAYDDSWTKVFEKVKIVEDELAAEDVVIDNNDKVDAIEKIEDVSFFRKIFNKIGKFFVSLFK